MTGVRLKTQPPSEVSDDFHWKLKFPFCPKIPWKVGEQCAGRKNILLSYAQT